MEGHTEKERRQAHDISELRVRLSVTESEIQRLRENEARYYTLFEESRDAIYLRDRSGVLLDANRAMEDLFGYTKEELIGMNVRDLRVVPSDMDKFQEELETKGSVRAYEERLLKKDGTEMICQITSTAGGSAGHTSPGYHGIIRDVTARKKSEEMLRVQASAMASSINAIAIADLDGNLTYANPSFLNLWGYEDEREVLGKPSVTFWQDEEKASEIKQVLPLEGSWVGELGARKKDGQLFTAQLSVNLVNDPEGNPICMMAFFLDITERKCSEAALRQSEEKFRLLFEKSVDAILLLDDGKVVDCNRAALDMMGGTDKTRLLGLHTHDFSPERQPDGRLSSEKASEIRATAFKQGSLRFEWVFQRMDGSEFPAEVMLISIPLNGMRILYSVFRDISRRKRAEEDLKKSEKQLAEIINFLPDATWAVDAEGKVTAWNRGAEEMTGIRADDIVGKGNFEYALPFYGVRRPLLIDLVLQPRHEKERNYDFIKREGNALIGEVEAPFPGMRKRYLWAKASAVYNSRGEIVGAIESVRDITAKKMVEQEKKRLESQLLHAQKMEAMGVLAGGIAHDFNNILTGLLGYAELSLYDIPEDGKARYSINQILEAGSRAKDLVKQILAFSRQTEQEKQPVRVNLIVKETLKFLRASLPRTINIQQKITTKDDMVLADPTQIHQVLMNLCTNAHHAMLQKGGELGITLHSVNLDEKGAAAHQDLKPGPYLKLTVSDTGHGMDNHTIKKIFDPYFTTKPKETGTGLGLSVVHGIVRDHGGAILVQSEKGKGSSFTVFLPSIVIKQEANPEIFEPIPRGTERILFVDDEKVIADLGIRMIGHLGYRVTAMTSSIDAIKAFLAKPDQYDLVITDMTMPGMTGDALARKIFEIRPDMPIILCTGFSESISKERAQQMGIRAFIMKPFSMREMGKAIRLLLDGQPEIP